MIFCIYNKSFNEKFMENVKYKFYIMLYKTKM